LSPLVGNASPENLREMKGMKGTGKANCGVKEKQKERTCSND
ncbi:hypothetical protein HMPREF1391_01100, partial [Helicobacter pylori GAM100Ai]